MRADTEDWKCRLRWWKRWAPRKEWEVNFVPLKSYFFFLFLVFFCILCVSTTLRASLLPLSFCKLDSKPWPPLSLHPSFFPLQSPIYTFLNVFFFFHAPMVLPDCYQKKIISEWWRRTEGIQPTTYETKKEEKTFPFCHRLSPAARFSFVTVLFHFYSKTTSCSSYMEMIWWNCGYYSFVGKIIHTALHWKFVGKSFSYFL